jgi:nucleoside-triphosphatase THEP1
MDEQLTRSTQKRIIILSGAKGVGKTSLIQKVIAWAKDHNIAVAGICSPAVFHNKQKTGIQVQEITTNHRKTLALVAGTVNAAVATEAWGFNEKNLEWGNEILDGIDMCQLLIIDELGVLEINQQRGWSHAFRVLKNLEYKLAVVVVRPELCEAFRKITGAEKVYQLRAENQPIVFQKIISEIINAQ